MRAKAEPGAGDNAVIGVFAKMFSNKERVEEVAPLEGDAGYDIRALSLIHI